VIRRVAFLIAAARALNVAFTERPDVTSRLETEWNSAAEATYARAKELADAASRAR
jgi:hypothetical protein